MTGELVDGELVDEELVDANLRPRYQDVTATPMANRTPACPSQIEATDTRKFRGEMRPRGDEISKKQLSSAESAALRHDSI